MTFETRNEIEYLSRLDRDAEIDVDLLEELGDRLEALRCFDQYIFEADWQSSESTTEGQFDDRGI